MLGTPCPNVPEPREGAEGPGRCAAAAPRLHRAAACSALALRWEEAQPRACLSRAGWMEPTSTSPLYIELRRRAPCDTLHRQVINCGVIYKQLNKFPTSAAF